MGKQPGLTTGNAAEPIFSPATMPVEPFVFSHGPPHEEAIEVSEDRVQGRLIKAVLTKNLIQSDRPSPADESPVVK